MACDSPLTARLRRLRQEHIADHDVGTSLRYAVQVIAADGHSYEREAIEAWLSDHNTSPITNLALPHKQLVPNRAVKSAIQTILARGGTLAGDDDDDMGCSSGAGGWVSPAAVAARAAAAVVGAAAPAGAEIGAAGSVAEAAPLPLAARRLWEEPLRLHSSPAGAPASAAAVSAAGGDVDPPPPGGATRAAAAAGDVTPPPLPLPAAAATSSSPHLLLPAVSIVGGVV